MMPNNDYMEQTTDGLMKAESSPWTEPFQQTQDNQETIWSDAAMQNAQDTQAAFPAKQPTEEPMSANHHMDDQTRNALSTIFYGN